MASLVEKHIPKSANIADVAAGKGHLKAALYQLGYKKVTCWDRRKRLSRGRPGQKYQLFDYHNAPRGYDALVAMHPDEATDHVVFYAGKHRIPAIVCPCCVKPSASILTLEPNKHNWLIHLKKLAHDCKLEVIETILPMTGDNRVLILKPK